MQPFRIRSNDTIAQGFIHAELEFAFYRSPPEVSLVFWTGVFLSPGRRIRVIGKETGPGPGGYG